MVHRHVEALERIEQEAWAGLVRVAPKSFAKAIGLESAKIGGALFVLAAKLPQFQFNFLNGAGLGEDDGACIGEAMRRFADARQSKFIIQIPQGPQAARMEALANNAGLQQSNLAWVKFARSTADAPVVETSLSVREIGFAERDMFGATAVAGFGMPQTLAPWLACIVGEPPMACLRGL